MTQALASLLEGEANDFSEDRNIILGGVSMKAKQFIGIGTLNVETGRGEVKARTGDFILTFSGAEILRAVMSASVFETLWKNLGGTEIPVLEASLQAKILNDKSGPDKFTLPHNPPIPTNPIVDEDRPGLPPHPSHLPADSLDRPKPIRK